MEVLFYYCLSDCCDICGDVGVPETLTTCSQCKINCEHMYCMRTPIEEHIDDWQCEECKSNSKQTPLASCLTGELPRVSRLTNSVEVRKKGPSGSWEKMVQTGKTKYITAKEAIMLSSGDTKCLNSVNNVTRHSKIPRPEIGMRILERTPIKPRTVPRGFSPKEGLASGLLVQPKPQRLGSMEIPGRNRQKFKTLSELQRSMNTLRPSQAPMNKHTQEEQAKARRLMKGPFSAPSSPNASSIAIAELQRSMNSLQPSQAPTNKHMQEEQATEAQSPQTKAKRLMRSPSSSPSSSNASPFTISGDTGHTSIEPRTSNAENVNNNLLPEVDEYSCSPALDALWKGNFSIQDDHRHGKLNHQLQAHPPSKVRRKIYEFSKQMPESLHFQLVPLKEFWNNLFKEFIPDENDIGLYFFPSVGERTEDYSSLLKSLSVKNLALRIQIADVELLVFTSKLLPVNRQYWQGHNFLWGVFHRLKRDTIIRSNGKELMFSVQPSDQSDNCEDADMDIDMVGGIYVGRVDIPVKREPLREKRVRFKEDSVTNTKEVSPGSNKPISSVLRRVSDPSVTVREETNDDIVPPGFEEVYRLRALQGSSSLVETDGVRDRKMREADDRNRLRCFPSSFPAKMKSVRL